MLFRNLSVVGIAVVTSLQVAAQTESSLLQKAAAFYDKAQCEEAIDAYETVLLSRTASNDDKNLAHFRIGYCSYNLGNYEKAATEFKTVLEKQPDEDEARLKYAESLFATEEFEESITQALKVKEADYVNDSKLLAARAYIEIQDSEKALAVLKGLNQTSPEMAPIIDFWKGLAYFQSFNETAATQSFMRAKQNSPEDLWTKSAATNWLTTLQDSKRDFHARAGISYGTDSNLAQLTYRASKNSSPDTSYYVSDSYLSGDLYFSTKAYRFGKVSMTPSIYATGLNYSKSSNKSYNPSSVTADLTTTYPSSYKWTYRTSLNYTDSRYNGAYYHNYLGVSAAALYAVSKRISASATLSYTSTIGNDQGQTVGPTFGIDGDNSMFYWLANVSYSTTTGTSATYVVNNGTASVASGATFSNYNTLSAKVGAGRVLFWDLDLLVTLTTSTTNYAKEPVPPPSAFSTEQRVDTSTVIQASLSKTLIERRMTATLSVSSTKNSSSGYQGLVYTSGVSPDYNYDRNQASLYLSYGF